MDAVMHKESHYSQERKRERGQTIKRALWDQYRPYGSGPCINRVAMELVRSKKGRCCEKEERLVVSGPPW